MGEKFRKRNATYLGFKVFNRTQVSLADMTTKDLLGREVFTMLQSHLTLSRSFLRGTGNGKGEGGFGSRNEGARGRGGALNWSCSSLDGSGRC